MKVLYILPWDHEKLQMHDAFHPQQAPTFVRLDRGKDY